MWMKCGQQYEFRYVEGKKKPPGVFMVEGGSQHAALEINNLYKMEQHEDLKPKAIVRSFLCTFGEKRKGIEDWEGETVDSVVNRGKILLPLYLKRFSRYYQPVHAEKVFKFIVGDVSFLCIMDTAGTLKLPRMCRKQKGVVDYKVTGKTQAPAVIEASLQLSAYWWGSTKMLKLKDPVTGFCNLKKTVVPVIEWKPAEITVQRIKWFKKLVMDTAKHISKGCFPLAKPDSWWCSKKWCGYWDECRGKNRNKKVIL
tara:strand:- start:4676 stop:5440 length:765 start_codon:yes stop_codon:yes gene_type:complete